MSRVEERNEGNQPFDPSTEEDFFLRSAWKGLGVIGAAVAIVAFPALSLINDAEDEQRPEGMRPMAEADRERRVSPLEAENQRLRMAAHRDYDPG